MPDKYILEAPEADAIVEERKPHHDLYQHGTSHKKKVTGIINRSGSVEATGYANEYKDDDEEYKQYLDKLKSKYDDEENEALNDDDKKEEDLNKRAAKIKVEVDDIEDTTEAKNDGADEDSGEELSDEKTVRGSIQN